VKPPAFDYLRPDSAAEALECLAQRGDEARVLAGGQSLMPMLNMRLLKPAIIVDIGMLAELDYVRVDRGLLEIGAATTQASLQAWPELSGRAPLLEMAMPYVGHFQTRNRGTVCGSLCHADPSSELPLCLAALNGQVRLASTAGTRTLTAAEFQTGMLSTARRADEILLAARFPVARAGDAYAFNEFTRRHGDFAIVAVAAVVGKAGIRLAVGGVADRPTILALDATESETVDDALNEFAWQLGGYDDIHASARYRRELVRRLGKRTIEEARACLC
jgi:2-furoyl-CoA dehydrogenase FAD binding subunit